MPERARQRKKQRARQLAAWESQISEALNDVRKWLHLNADEVVPDPVLVAEIVALGHHDAVPARDVVIPGGDIDRVKTWCVMRLLGRADTDALRRSLAQDIAASPDWEPSGRRLAWGPGREVIERAIAYHREHRSVKDD